MAMEKLKEWVASRQRWGENNLEHFYGYDWCEVCEEEEYVFGLTTEDMAAITPVYEAYEALADIAYNDLHADRELCDELRSEMDWLKQDTVDALDFGRFADLFGVSQVKAYCFFHKYEQWQIRQGLITFSVRGRQ